MWIVFYYAPMSSASPVASALAELGVAHERVRFDLSKQEHRSPEFLALNPNGKVPTLVVDGSPMFEALAILLYLGDRFGVDKGLWPASDHPARVQAYSWCTWAYVTYGSTLNRLLYSTSDRVDAKLHSQPQAELATRQLDELLKILDDRLAKRAHLLGDDYSLADLVVASMIGYSVWCGAPVSRHARVQAWLERFQQREAYTTVMAES